MNAGAIYSSWSLKDDSDQDASFASQLTKCLEKAKELGITISMTNVFFEVNTELNPIGVPPKLAQLTDLVRSGTIGTVLCSAPDRFTLEPSELVGICEEFTNNGVRLFLVEPPDPNSPIDQVMRYIVSYTNAKMPDIGLLGIVPGNNNPGLQPEHMTLKTSAGNINCRLHSADSACTGTIFLSGARGGLDGPSGGVYGRLSVTLQKYGITSLRLDYRNPNALRDCIGDASAGIAFLASTGCDRIVLVGHSFGGAVAISVGASSRHIAGVVALSSQSKGASSARMLAPRPLLVVHGSADSHLPLINARRIMDWARQPKSLKILEGAGHNLKECGEELEVLLEQWIRTVLSSPINDTR